MPYLIVTVGQMWPWHDGTHVMGMHWAWWFFWFPVVLLLVWALARRSDGAHPPSTADGPGAVEVLRRRFADGEIDEEEFRRRMDVLRESG